ncbi:hypothetical protein BD779DRAFT_1612913 [Infundibulicybe gibba]|nr:hypothetical protein BD779DRAFT_1612913 [Infundibulicybe gibba]
MEGRALVVCMDRASNNFGQNNTNVAELYHRVIKNERQLTYYSSGVGTYTKPSWRSFAYWKRLVFNVIDMIIAWNFEKTVLGAYHWLAINYREGDRVYLFGFSRGAYQVRVLAAMIHKVGLVFPGNEEQIPIAYELYADPESSQYTNSITGETFDMAARFKKTFSREGVRVHFIGVWDTVSSIGMFKSGSLPLTNTCEGYCYMRHALALDERRIKFLPEYAQGGESWVQNPAQVSTRDGQLRPRVKEVWFAGSHSDINTELNNTTILALWMGNETTMARLELRPSRAVQDWEKLKEDRPTESLSFIWWILELFPLKYLSYKNTSGTRWYCPRCLSSQNLAKLYLGDPISQTRGS